MPSRAATLSGVTAYNVRAIATRNPRRAGRAAVGSAVLGLGSVSMAALMAGTATVAAAWMVSGSLGSNPAFRASAPFALERAGLPLPPARLAEPADMFGGALASANPTYTPPEQNTREATREHQLASIDASLPVSTQPAPPPARAAERAGSVPLPAARPLYGAAIPVKTITYHVASISAASAVPAKIEPHEPAPVVAAPRTRPAQPEPQMKPQIAAAAPTPAAPAITGSIGTPDKPARPQLAYNNPETPTGADSHTAIYDIVAHTVYLPDGERLEAHSGLGRMLDDPQYVSAKARGPTPPNVYNLTLRDGLFHGVQALRLNPVGDSRMYGRDGILAHTYMLGPSGQSFGCVSFKNYQEFLHAFERGEVNRLVVVTHLPSPPPGVRADRATGERYAFDLESAH
jgi:hypothetical protein